MTKNIFAKAAFVALLTLGVGLPVNNADAGNKGKYKSCVRSCQAQFANCYRQTKNRNQCRAQQAQCSQGCASYLSSRDQRVFAMVKYNDNN